MIKFIKENNERIILFLILLIGAVLRIYNVWGLSLSNDELSAIARAQISGFSEFIKNGIIADIHPAGVEFFLYLWIKVFGTSVFMVRLPFIICGVFSIYFAYLLTANWFNKQSGLFVAAAICSLEFSLMYSQIARPFVPAMLFTLMSALYWTKIIFNEKSDRKNIIALAVSMSMAAYCHYFASVIIIFMIVSGTFFLKKSNIKHYALSVLLALVLYTPNILVLIFQLKNSSEISWIKVPDSGWFFEHIYFVLNNSQLVLYTVIAIFVITHIISFTEIKIGRFHILSLIWFVIPFFIGFYYSLWIKPILENSILLFTFPFLLIFIFSFVQSEKKIFNYAAIFILLICCIYSTIGENKYYSTYHFGEFRDIAAKATEWNNKYEDKNVTKCININSPYYINYYLDKFEKPLSFAMYKNEGKMDLRTLNQIVQKSSTPYFLYAWSGVTDPNESGDIILAKYPYILKQINYNGMAAITLYSKYDSTNAIIQSKPVYYIFNGFEEKQTWDKDTGILNTEKVWKGKYSIKLDARDEYGPAYTSRIYKMTNKHVRRVQVSLWALATGTYKDAQIVASLNFKDDENKVYENYFWLSSKFEYFIEKGKWGQVFFSFTLPELRSVNDELKIYVWNPDKQPLYIDNYEMKLFEK